MKNEKLEQLLRTVDPSKRLFLRKFLLGAAFAVPIIASYSVKDLAYAIDPCPNTATVTTTTFFTVTRTTTIIVGP